MNSLALILAIALALLLLLGAALAWQARRRNVQCWITGYARQRLSKRFSPPAPVRGPTHVLLCIADHFEPHWGGASESEADSRVAAWVHEYPRLLGEFRDSDGRQPRHTFFYPIDQYEPRHVDALADLCRGGYGEIEIHLHHDGDNAEHLERRLRRFTRAFAERHGVLGRWRGDGSGEDGAIAYGFVHGNWALCNSRADGRWCGVNDELSVLRRTGCYADFTMPSAPDATQTRIINSIYYATGGPHRPKSHDHGPRVGTGPQPHGSLMLIQGPLGIWRPAGRLMPRIENGCIQRGQPPSKDRLDNWMRARIGVPTRPDWVFVKLHTHGAVEANRRVLLGAPGLDFHRGLARRAAEDPRFRFHYVTAREMFNLAKAAEAGWTGSVGDALDFTVAPPGPRTAVTEMAVPEESAST
jgi:hypothetical protein